MDRRDREQDAITRQSDATERLATAQRRLTRADSRNAERLAAALAAVEAARTAHADTGDEASRVSLIEAEAACEAETVQLVRSGIERRDMRNDLDHAAQHLAAGASSRLAAARDRAQAQADRHAASNDRGRAKANRQQSALDRAADPYLALHLGT